MWLCLIFNRLLHHVTKVPTVTSLPCIFLPEGNNVLSSSMEPHFFKPVIIIPFPFVRVSLPNLPGGQGWPWDLILPNEMYRRGLERILLSDEWTDTEGKLPGAMSCLPSSCFLCGYGISLLTALHSGTMSNMQKTRKTWVLGAVTELRNQASHCPIS